MISRDDTKKNLEESEQKLPEVESTVPGEGHRELERRVAILPRERERHAEKCHQPDKLK